MLSAKYRIPANKIPLVARKGRRFKSDLFTMISFKRTPSPVVIPRFCFIVSTKISKSAVVRNRIKRRLRAAAYALLPAWDSNQDYIIMVSSTELVDTDFPLIKDYLLNAIKSFTI